MPSNNRCIFGCDTTGVPLHSFPHPVNNADIFKIWLEVIGEPLRKMAPSKIYYNKRVCDRHFTEKVKYNNGGLNSLAIPTLNLPNPPIILCHADSVQQNVQSTQQLTTDNQIENGNHEIKNDAFKLEDIIDIENKLFARESEKIASYERVLIDVATQTDGVPIENQEERTEMEIANEQFGSFVARELDTVPELKRQQIIKDIINLFKNT